MATWTLKEKSMGDLEVVIEGEAWKKAVNKAFNKIASNVEIKGFRKGKAPKAILESKVSPSERWYEAVNDNMNNWLREALAETGLMPITQPELDIKEVNDEKVVAVFTFTVEPEAKVADYKGLPYSVEVAEVTEEEVQAELNTMRERFSDTVVKEGTAENGDMVNIDYEGFKEGVAFEGGKAEGYDLVLGSGSFIPGFEEKLVGAVAGEEKDLDLTFPEDYHSEDLKGAAVVFKVKVNEVKTKVLPEVDDDFAQDVNMPDVETAEQLIAAVKERLANNKKNEAENKADNDLIEAFCEKVDVEVPDVMVEDEVQGQINQLASQLQQYGMSLTGYMQMMGKTVDDLKAEYAENAIKTVKIRLGLSAVAKAEGIDVTDEDIEEEMKKIADMYGMELDQVKGVLSPEMMKADLVHQRAMQFLKDNAAK